MHKCLERRNWPQGALGVRLQYLDVRDPRDLDNAFSIMKTDHVGALLVLPTRIYSPQQLVPLATKNRLPSVFLTKDSVEAGGLMSYGPSFDSMYPRAAVYVD